MQILLLSANTGGGHNAAALAIKKQFERLGVACEIRDAVTFVSGLHSDIVSAGHTCLYRHFPKLFGVGYHFEEQHPPRFLYNQMALGAKRFADFLTHSSFDAVVSTHLFGSMLTTEVRKRYHITIPHYLVVTDYTRYPGVEMVDVDRYFIGAEALIPLYTDVGILADRLMVSGIPLRSSFLKQYDKDTTRQLLHLPRDKRIVLLFSGSIGCGNLHRVAPAMERALPNDAHLVIICGHNKRTYEQLLDLCGSKTTVVGYTDRVAEYLAAADVCLTKPGGLSITELLVMRLPMVLMLSVPGCETRNMAFFKEQGIAIPTDNWEDAIRQTAQLLCEPHALEEMQSHLMQTNYPGGAAVIAKTVLEDLYERENEGAE